MRPTGNEPGALVVECVRSLGFYPTEIAMSITLKTPHQQVETFTSDEHAILSKWLRT